MQAASTPYRLTDWLSVAAKLLPILVILAIALEFRPPKPPKPPVYRVEPGISGIHFYSSACGQYQSNPEYNYRFSKNDTRCIFGVLHTNRIPSHEAPQVLVHALFYGPDGQMTGEKSFPAPNNRGTDILTIQAGWIETGHWRPGVCRAEVIVEDKLVAAGEFLITDP